MLNDSIQCSHSRETPIDTKNEGVTIVEVLMIWKKTQKLVHLALFSKYDELMSAANEN